MYQQDSFFDLSLWGRAGVICISLALFVLFILLARALLRGRPTWLRLIGALGLFWVFVWTSPQAYYQFYHLLFEDLPHQWVIWPPRSPLEAVKLLVFQGPQNLSHHGQGLLGWAMLAAPFADRAWRGQA